MDISRITRLVITFLIPLTHLNVWSIARKIYVSMAACFTVGILGFLTIKINSNLKFIGDIDTEFYEKFFLPFIFGSLIIALALTSDLFFRVAREIQKSSQRPKK